MKRITPAKATQPDGLYSLGLAVIHTLQSELSPQISPERHKVNGAGPMCITYVGHATVLIELDGVRVLTDPLLRGRVLHIERRAPPVDVRRLSDVDVVLVSHAHHD